MAEADPLGQALYDAGFRGNDLATMYAIALAESGGNPDATNNTLDPSLPGFHPVTAGFSPEYSVGAFQINLAAHGDNISELEARDLHASARYAYGLVYGFGDEGGNGFAPWTTYQQYGSQLLDRYRDQLGPMLRSLPEDATVNGPAQTNRGSQLRTAASKGTTEVKKAVVGWGDVLAWLQGKGPARAAWIGGLTLAAVLAILVGVFLVAQESRTVRDFEAKAAGTATKAGV